ncbi:MAG: hypothetical protein AAFQ45_15525 [Pseudomonadota bacterium]
MSILRSIVFDEVCQRRNIRDSDVTKLRALFFADAIAAPDDVTALVRMNTACPVQGEAWAPFLIEAVVDFVVAELEPRGYLSRSNAAWLVDLIAPDGAVKTLNELDILLAVLERARWVPEDFCGFILDQIRLAIVEGRGPLRTASGLEPQTIANGDLTLIGFALTHFASDGFLPVTATELAAIAQIDAQSNAESQPTEWEILMLRVLSSVLLYQNGYAASSRWQMLACPIELPEPEGGDAGIGSDAWVSDVLEPVIGAHRRLGREERAIHRLEIQRVDIITDDELRAAGPDDLAAAVAHCSTRSRQLRTIGRSLAEAGFDVSLGPGGADHVSEAGSAVA